MLRHRFHTLALALVAGALCAPASVSAERVFTRHAAKTNTVRQLDRAVVATTRGAADLEIGDFHFLGGPDKKLKVEVENTGNGAAGPSVLRLTVRRIDGIAVGRVVEVNTPAIAAGASAFVPVATDAILPNAVALADTTFKLDADATSAVAESDEANNRAWHNL